MYDRYPHQAKKKKDNIVRIARGVGRWLQESDLVYYVALGLITSTLRKQEYKMKRNYEPQYQNQRYNRRY